MAGSRNRHGLPQGPRFAKHHKNRGVISPKAKEDVVGITPEMVKSRPMSGGEADAKRVRIIRDFYSDLPDEIFTYQEVTKEVPYSFTLGRRVNIMEKQVPDDRTFVIDDVYFFATPLVGSGLVPAGSVEGSVQAFFEIGAIVPVEIDSTRLQPASLVENRAYFPFFNDRVGAREVTFSLYAKRGRIISAYYINRFPTPIPLRTVGIRIEGWLVDSNALEEILEQQR